MNKKTKEIIISTEYITLAQFLKFADVIQSGGEAKQFLHENEVLVNGEVDQRRGRKLRDKDVVEVLNQKFQIVQK